MRFRRKNNEAAESRFDQLLDQGSVPSFPQITAEAMTQISAPDVDLAEVAATISVDPKLTVTVLKLANSPSFSPRSPIASVHHASVMLGRNQLEALLIASGVGEMIPSQAAPGFSPSAFWLASAMRAAVAAEVAAVCEPSSKYEQFTAALLQDMAQPILLARDAAYADLVASHGGTHAALVHAETEVLGWTHPEMGRLLGDRWGLPEGLTRSISMHHEEPAEGYEIAQWASLVDAPEPDVDLLIAEAATRLGITDADLVIEVLDEASGRAAEIAAAFG